MLRCLPIGNAEYEGELIGPNILLFKLMATGAVTLTQGLFMKWRQYKHQAQREQERQRQQQQYEANTSVLAIQQHTPVGISDCTLDATAPLGYNFALLDEQEVVQQQVPQLLAEF